MRRKFVAKEVNEELKDTLRKDMKYLKLTKNFVKSRVVSFYDSYTDLIY